VAKPERVAPGAYRVDAIGLSNAVSVLLVEGVDGWTLIDTGLGSSPGRIWEALATLGGRPEDLRRIYLTHHHIDHIGGLPSVHEWAPDAEVMASEHEAMIISGERNPDTSSGAAFRLANRLTKLPVVTVDRVVAEGEDVAGFRVLLTPGHTLGHTSLLRSDGEQGKGRRAEGRLHRSPACETFGREDAGRRVRHRRHDPRQTHTRRRKPAAQRGGQPL